MLMMSFDDALTRINFSFVYFLQFYLLKFFWHFSLGGFEPPKPPLWLCWCLCVCICVSVNACVCLFSNLWACLLVLPTTALATSAGSHTHPRYDLSTNVCMIYQHHCHRVFAWQLVWVITVQYDSLLWLFISVILFITALWSLRHS